MNYIKGTNLTKAYGDKTLFKDIEFTLNQYDKTALIARNGSGKSTLLRIITGGDIPDAGELYIRDGISVGFLPQEPVMDNNQRVWDVILNSDAELTAVVKEYRNALKSGDAEKTERASALMDEKNAWNFEQEIKIVLDKLNIFDLEKPIGQMSGGEKKRVALAGALLQKPDLLILDEPTNHLDFKMTEWLENYISNLKITLLLVTHDRYFLNRVCNNIWELDKGKMYEYEGNFNFFLKKRQERIELFEKHQQDLKREIKKEAEWAGRQPKARGTKAKFRLDNLDALKEKVVNNREKDVNINIKVRRLGKKIIDIYGISKQYDGNSLISNFSYKFSRFQKAAIVGDNGTGKTTFLNLITNNLAPDKGHVDIGETVVFGYYKQDGLNFSDEDTVLETVNKIADSIQLEDSNFISAAAFLEYFLFPRHTHHRKVSTLSGGEKKRLYLLTVLMQNPNFLILDEPSNDLDIMTLDILENYLKQFKGNVLVVSHDRYFTDKVADSLFLLDGEGNIKQFAGKYSEYIEIEKQKLKEVSKKKQVSQPIKSQNTRTNKKMTYKEKVEFEQLENEIEKLTQEKSEIEKFLSSPETALDKIAEKSKNLAEINDLLDEKEYRWLELSEKL